MICNNCGSNLPDGTKFCTKCGSPIYVAPVAEPVQPVQPVQPVYNVPQQPAQQPPVCNAPQQPSYNFSQQPAYNMPQQPAPKKNNTKLIIIIIAAVVAVIGIVLGVLFATGVIGGSDTKNDDKKTTESTTEAASAEPTEGATENTVVKPTEAPSAYSNSANDVAERLVRAYWQKDSGKVVSCFDDIMLAAYCDMADVDSVEEFKQALEAEVDFYGPITIESSEEYDTDVKSDLIKEIQYNLDRYADGYSLATVKVDDAAKVRVYYSYIDSYGEEYNDSATLMLYKSNGSWWVCHVEI